MSGFEIVHRDAMERNGKWTLCRRSLGLGSFGMALVEIPPGESIPEHDETERDQEEVFVVLEGDATMVVDGADHPAPAGTFVRVDPERRRTVRNASHRPVSVLIVSAPQTSGYEPMGWN
ncbi:MAG TPA: cupin domain-containing protein [Gaiellaceae bacterium]|nr:cupin domain-containing protein [Gaiellaceae bacterium]